MKIYKKVYGIRGMVEYNALIDPTLRVLFTNGVISTHGITPATYTTSNTGIQKSIENSVLFRSGRIKIERSIVVGELSDEVKEDIPVSTNPPVANSPVTDPPTVEDPQSKDYPDVTNTNGAKEILIGVYNVLSSELPNKTAALAKAAELGVTFSNWKKT